MSDNLPNTGISYGSASVANVGSGVTGGANISCSIASNDLTCVASGGAVTLGTSNGSFDVVFTATPTSAVTFSNPRSGGACSVDPNNNNAESNESNNGCSNSVAVAKADTTTTITSDDPDPSVSGQAVSVHFTVVPTGSGTPTGNVTVTDGTQSCTGTVAAGQCTIAFATAGARSLTATYAGDANYNASPASASVSHQVNPADTTTTITSDTPDPSAVGQAVTVNFVVAAAAPGAGTPAGNVTVSDGVDACTATVATGSCSVSLTTAGPRTLTATYAGNANFNASTSTGRATHRQRGDDDDDDHVRHSRPLGRGPGRGGALQRLGRRWSGTPTGDVTVTDGTVSCTATVAAGQCSLTFTSTGGKSLTASYAGDATFSPSTSATEAHTVSAASTTTTISDDAPDPSVVGQSVTVDYDVAPSAPGAGTPTGDVTVSDGSVSCTATVAAGHCTLTFATAGARSLTATYAGDSRFNASTSAAEAHTVGPASTTTAITSDGPDPSDVGNAVTVQYAVAPVAPGDGTPTGNVTVSDGVNDCTGTVAAGSCEITLTTAGARPLTATYGGNCRLQGQHIGTEPHMVDGTTTTTTIISDSPDPSVVGEAVTVRYSVVATAVRRRATSPSATARAPAPPPSPPDSAYLRSRRPAPGR